MSRNFVTDAIALISFRQINDLHQHIYKLRLKSTSLSHTTSFLPLQL